MFQAAFKATRGSNKALDFMKRPPTNFEVHINGNRFADASVNLEDQLEINLASVAGQDSAVLAITAFIPGVPKSGNYIYSERAVVGPGDTVTIAVSAVGYATATGIEQPEAKSERDASTAEEITCSFCGKNRNEVRKIVAGSNAFICDKCIHLCQDIVRDEI